jgi:hypothetical protein
VLVCSPAANVCAAQEFWEKKEAMLIFERQILQTLAYDLNTKDVYKYDGLGWGVAGAASSGTVRQ